MKAAQINEYGDPSVVHINQVEKPIPGPGQVLVEVHASSLNPFDSKVRQGALDLKLPITLGGDITGIVTELGDGVDGLSVDDKVYGQAAAVSGNSGAIAEYAVTKADQVAAMPANLDFNQAASLPLVGTSALLAITEQIHLQPNQRIFIHGGAGGIGSIAIQIAKSIGAYVATTAAGDNIDLVRQLGADKVIDYTSQSFADVLHDYDAVFDTVGGDDFDTSLNILKRGGIAVSMIAPPNETRANELGVTASMIQTRVTAERLNKLRELVESDSVKPQVGRVFSLDQIQQAFTARESGSIAGKVVIKIIA